MTPLARAAAFTLALVVACGEDSSDPSGDSGGDQDGRTHEILGDASIDAPRELPCGDVGYLAEGASQASENGLFSLALRELTPADPRKGENAWTIALVSADGDPLTDASLTSVRPFMPEHGHDGRFPPKVEPMREPATFAVNRLNLWMSGLWEVTFVVRVADREDRAVVDVCVPN